MMTNDEALHLFRSSDLVGIGIQADAMRKQLHPEPVISYALNAGGGSLDQESRQVITLELRAQSTFEDRLSQFEELRKRQEQGRQFVCFAVIMDQNSDVTASEYLKTLAIARLYFHNIAHAQVPVGALDTKLAQVAIRFGANDLGVVGLGNSGAGKAVSEEQVRRLIRDAGLIPKQRDSLFQTYFLY